MWARSMVFMYRYIVPVSGSDRTVAYRELASGQDCRLQRPVTLYSLRQKFCPFVVLFLELVNVSRKILALLCLVGWLVVASEFFFFLQLVDLPILQATFKGAGCAGGVGFFSRNHLLEFVGAELLVNHLPDDFVGHDGHGGRWCS